jgi:hypothetical protein
MNAISQDRGRSITAFSLIGLGVLFLLSQIFGFSLLSILWPLFIIVPGAAFLYFALTGDKKMSGLAVPGTVITGTGLILLFQSITHHWESWAYAWTLYPVFVGMALTFMGTRMEDAGTYKAGRGLVRFGGIAFVVAAAFFELFIFNGGGFLSSLALPLVLMGIGAAMLFGRGLGGSMSRKSKNDDFAFSGRKSKPKYVVSADVNPDLQRKIDAALAEEDEPQAELHTPNV